MTEFDEIFRLKLSNAKASLPQDEWEVLEKRYATARRRKTIFWACSGVLAAAILTAILFLPNNNIEKLPSANENIVAKSSTSSDDSSFPCAETPEPVKLCHRSATKMQSNLIASVDTSVNNVLKGKENDPDTITNKASVKEITKDVENSTSNEEYWATTNPTATKVRGLYLINVGTTLSGGISSGTSGNDLTSSPSQQTHSVNVNHHQPVKFMLSVGVPISTRLYLETGLSYSCLRSDKNVSSFNSSYTVKQRLDYIGIPLGLSYKIWSNRHLRTYISAGGMAEKMVSGYSKSNSGTSKLHIDGLQYSVYGTAGLGIQVAPHFSIGFEPGISYHYHVKASNIQTLYSDFPLDMELRLSLKVEL
jgi:hypothetical protein